MVIGFQAFLLKTSEVKFINKLKPKPKYCIASIFDFSGFLHTTFISLNTSIHLPLKVYFSFFTSELLNTFSLILLYVHDYFGNTARLQTSLQ